MLKSDFRRGAERRSTTVYPIGNKTGTFPGAPGVQCSVTPVCGSFLLCMFPAVVAGATLLTNVPAVAEEARITSEQSLVPFCMAVGVPSL